MDQTEVWTNAGILIAALLAALVGYFKRRPPTPPDTGVLTAIGLSWLTRHDADRLLSAVETCAQCQSRIATALEAMADKRQMDLDEKIETLVEKLDKLTPPPRQRR